MAERTTTACIRVEHDTHMELIYQEVSRQAVDDLVYHLIELAQRTVADPTLPMHQRRFLINTTQVEKTQPLGHLIRELRRNRTNLELGVPVYGASLINEEALTGVINAFITSFFPRSLKFRIFSSAKYDEALAWVLSHKDDSQS